MGFGGNGNTSLEETVGSGHCLTTGPFANAEVLIFGIHNLKHCLSRGFRNESETQSKALLISPKVVERTLQMLDYQSFNTELENGPHNAIPWIVRGDFLKFSAPNGVYISAFVASQGKPNASKQGANLDIRSCILSSSCAAGPTLVDLATKEPGTKTHGFFWPKS